MTPLRLRLALLGGAAIAAHPSAAFADVGTENSACEEGVCHVKMDAAQLLSTAEQLVHERRFAEAAPLIAALGEAPQYTMQRQFLSGYTAVETGDLKGAVKIFRAALVDHPEQTRIRLELARALMLQGKTASADHHFRLAGQDRDLPEEVLQNIRQSRGILRSKRQWSFNVNAGFAPDSNISNGTNATTIDANFGNQTVPVILSDGARAKSGTGQTLGFSGSARLGLLGDTKLVVESDARGVNYKGKGFDDYTGQLAVGPAFQLSEATTLTVQGVGSQRYYGGKRAATGFGLRTALQVNIGESQRVGLSLDGRRTDSGFADSYSGWQMGAYATYERVIARSIIASASIFARRDALKSGVYSNNEFGGSLGIGGELPHGITAGVSAGVSRAVFDKPFAIFSTSPRHDLRMNAQATIGLRSLRWLGFSPSITYSFSKSASSLALYDSKRSRLAFTFARYF